MQKDSHPPKYFVFNLGAPGGGTIAMAASINNIGWIAGDAYQTGNASEHAELWVGSPFDLGTLGGTNSAVGWPNQECQRRGRWYRRNRRTELVEGRLELCPGEFPYNY